MEGTLKLWEAGLQVSISKCKSNVNWMKYLGFILATEGIEVDLEKVSMMLK